jgi:uncharacterized cupredoxin-like copper-binding protein
MDKAAFVHRRKKRYMAVILGEFETKVEPHVPQEVSEQFKWIVRQKLHAMAIDTCEVIALKPGEEINAAAVELRDQVEARRVTA